MVIDVKVLTSGWTIAGVIASFLVAVVALGLGVSSFIQTKNLQKKERKERLLKEIIEWAIDVSKWRPKEMHKDMVGIKNNLKQQEIIHAYISRIMDSFVEMRGRNQYVSTIAMKIDINLEESVNKLIDELEAYINLLDEWLTTISGAVARNAIADDVEYFQKAEEHEYQVERLALKVIEEANKIKTRDIG